MTYNRCFKRQDSCISLLIRVIASSAMCFSSIWLQLLWFYYLLSHLRYVWHTADSGFFPYSSTAVQKMFSVPTKTPRRRILEINYLTERQHRFFNKSFLPPLFSQKNIIKSCSHLGRMKQRGKALLKASR